MTAVASRAGQITTVDVAELCAQLVRFDTTNHGLGRSNGEAKIAAFIADRLRAVGYDPLVIGPNAERLNVVLRIPGTDRSLPALLVHGHLDVVPAEASDWSVPPFAGLIDDGYVWGRGANDMKDMVAMMLACALDWAASGERPNRDVVLAFVADEEDAGLDGAIWLVEQHPELFAGVDAAIGESGGTPVLVAGDDGAPVHLYPVATAERGTMHFRVRATGTAGHGSRPAPDNPVLAVVDALHRVGNHRWPIHLSATVREFLVHANHAIGRTADLTTDAGVEAAVDALGEAASFARYTIRGTSTPTMFDAGYKVNVIPQSAAAEVDVRCPPGFQDRMLATLQELLGDDVVVEFSSMFAPIEAPIDSAWFAAMEAAIRRSDPAAVVVPYCLGGGTDAKAFARLGIACYGFAPLGIDPEGRTASGAHGIDERVPVAALETGRRVLADFLTNV